MPQLSSEWRGIYEKLNRIVSGRKSEKQVIFSYIKLKRNIY